MRKINVLCILTLLLPFTAIFGQYTDTTTYDFRDGVIITDNGGQSDDGSLKLDGTYSLHGATYGLNMKPDAEIKIGVSGSCVISFLGSQYSSLLMNGTTFDGTPLDPETVSTTVTNDLSDTYEFTYYGVADTLIFTATGSGSDVYLPLINVYYTEPPVTYDFRDGVIINDNGGQSDDGSLKLSGTYSLHGATYGLNMKPDAEIKIAVIGSSIIRFLGSQYSSLSMTGTTYDGTALDPETVSTTVINDLSDTYEFTYYGFADTLIFTATGSGSDVYLPLIDVIPIEQPALYDFRDGVIINDNGGQSDDGSLKLSGTYSLHGSTYGLNMKPGAQIKVAVTGSGIVRFLGSQYSSLLMSGETYDGTSLSPASVSSQVVNDLSDYYEFSYSGDADTLIFEATGSGSDIYLPLMEVIPAEVETTPWVQKSGDIIFNGDTISITSGATESEAAVVELKKGTVISATIESASVRMDLGGNTLDSFTPELLGDISKVTISNDTIYVAYADSSALPFGYIVKVADNSQTVVAEPGTTYNYNFADGSVIPQIGYSTLRYPTFVTEDGIITINSNTEEFNRQFAFHDAKHGAYMFDGNTFDIVVASNAVVTFKTCYYSSSDAVFIVSDAEGTELDTISATNSDVGAEAEGSSSYVHSGEPTTITFTLVSSGSSYLHAISIENAEEIVKSGKIDVWDFGAEQLDTSIYMNWLNVDLINAWYDGAITVGSAGNVLPSGFSSGMLSWSGGGNDRLRTSNTSLTRYDAQVSSSSYTGRVYVNSSAATGRYMSLLLSEDDEVTVIALTQNGSGRINFQNVGNPEGQTDQINVGTDATAINFVAKTAGTYHIFDDQDKPSYFRIYRKDAFYSYVHGSIDTSLAEYIPTDFTILFENEAGKVWESTLNEAGYSVILPAGYTYQMSLANANGYVITSENSFVLADSTVDSTNNVVIEAVELYNITGAVTGLGDEISNAKITFTADPEENKIFIPEVILDAVAGTYSVQLEPNCEYTISAKGVNDFYIDDDTITIVSITTADIVFSPKPVYDITINATGLNTAQTEKLALTFANLNEAGYSYTFTSMDGIALRNGVYQISYNGLDSFAVEMGMTSNLTVDNAATSKELIFSPVINWSFDDKPISGSAYEGLLFTGNIGSEVAKGHLTGKDGATIKIPVVADDIIRITYYYTADFTIEGTDNYTTTSQSTGTLEYAEYSYTGTEAGFVTISIGSGVSTTYITNIEIGGSIEYSPVITVGEDKDYQTINGALDAIAKMIRTSEERVTVMIDPGNYEEMLVIDLPNVTFTNAADTPSIALLNEGVDISKNAVRITSYYGHGYNYYSMGNDQKWDAEVLRVNKENGYLSYVNTGSGTNNGSYWNATVVVSAKGFVANYIIIENSYNQYISQKESEDVVVEWESGGKGERPTDYGNTSVQDKSFVERAAAIAMVGADKAILNKCRVVGRQDSFFGNEGSRVAIYKGTMMGGTDYIFGGMIAVFYQSDLDMNTSEDGSDVCYITAAQQSSSRGYLMYECTVTSPEPGIETASQYISKPGYFGRPWQATTSEVVFYNTTIKTTDFPGFVGQSLIQPVGWLNSLGGESELMYEYGTIEESGIDNSASRASWATLLTTDELNDNTAITTLNFTKGNDGWDPIPLLAANDTFIIDPPVSINESFAIAESDVDVYSYENSVIVRNVTAKTLVNVYSLNGVLVKSVEITGDAEFTMKNGLYVVSVLAEQKQRIVKVLIK